MEAGVGTTITGAGYPHIVASARVATVFLAFLYLHAKNGSRPTPSAG
jgi:hypothetical protein